MNEDKELKAMADVAKALDEVEGDARARVLQWANSRYGTVKRAAAGASAIGEGEEAEGSDFSDVAELYTAAGPTSDPERALVVSYWFQVHEKKANIDAQSVNTELKHLGHPISNITSAFSALIERKPGLAMQVRKKGKTKQARKNYRLTTEGIQAVTRMFSGRREESPES